MADSVGAPTPRRWLPVGLLPAVAGAAVVAVVATGAPAPTDLPAATPIVAEAAPTGFAAVAGSGLSGTTGGAGGRAVTARSASELAAHATAEEPLVITVEGRLDIDGMQKVASNKTILGAGRGASIVGGGLNIARASNVIIRNLHFRDADDDSINVQESSHHVWIDHNSFTNGYDGALDIKRESDFVTVSWNHFYDHGKTLLLGHSDGHTADAGKLRVTYHHNFFDGTGTRHPRVRFSGLTHVYNNYYRGNEYGVASTMDANVLVEGNYFEGVEDPTLVGYADSDPGNLVQRSNVFTGSGAPQAAGNVPNPPYRYALDAAAQVPSIVRAGAGADKEAVGPGGGTPTPPQPQPQPQPEPPTGEPAPTPEPTPAPEPPRPAPAPSSGWSSFFSIFRSFFSRF